MNAKSNYGWTALHEACSEGHLNIVNRLIELGVDVNAKTNEGKTSLHYAQRYKHLDIVNRLMELDSCLGIGSLNLHQ